MHLLCIDIGSGTQDILYLDTQEPVENAIQLVLPAPTRLVARRIEAATSRGNSIVFAGETMGGGANTWALKRHLEAGLKAYATPQAARTFDDDLEEVASWGVTFVSPEEATRLQGACLIETRDVTLDVLAKALSEWDIRLAPDCLGVAVLDHGAAPPAESDRVFRFQNLERQLRLNRSLEALIYTPDSLPHYLTRMEAVARSLPGLPIVLMDTGAAAVMGASLDRVVSSYHQRLSINAGNSHTMAFYLSDFRVLGMFEHHTSLLSAAKLDDLLERLLAARLTAEELQEQGGHGAVVFERSESPPFVSITGPRRQMLAGSRMNPYFASPFGSMMLAGCFGLARAAALKLPQYREEVERALLIS